MEETAHIGYTPVGHRVEGRSRKTQEAQPGEVLHVRRKQVSMRALLVVSAGGWGLIRVPINRWDKILKRKETLKIDYNYV